jgi:PAS domain S-box-containing protein
LGTDEVPGTVTSGETTLAELLEMVDQLISRRPHARCRVGEGSLAPLAQALNRLAASNEEHHAMSTDPFGVETLVAQSPIMMMTVDASEHVRFMNYNVPGYTATRTWKRSIYDFVVPDQVEMVRGHIRRVLNTGEPSGYEIRSSIPEGPEWFAVKLGPIRSGEQVVGLTMSLMDITDQKRVQARLEQSNRELESFASVASHDLQEPLRKIQTFSDRLKATCSEALGPEGRDYLERMNNAATRMRGLIDDLLSFSRVSSKAQAFVRVDLAEVARGVVEDLEACSTQAGATITLGELPELEADPPQMRQLLQNLLSNALKFRRDDVAPVVSIRATVEPEGRRVMLLVEDNGIGFDEKYHDRIFNVFQRLHGRGKYEGTGIGLAICRKIAERHGGTIRARSTPGQGSTFIVSLPLKQSNPR